MVVVNAKPHYYMVSMLQSQKDEFYNTARHDEEQCVAECEESANKVVAAKFELFKKGLAHDWKLAQSMKGALSIIDDETHLWRKEWLHKVTVESETAVTWYMQGKLTMAHPSNFSQTQSH